MGCDMVIEARGMGDLRNKIAKQIATERHQAYLKKHFPPQPRPPEQRCQCGFTCKEAPLWSVLTNEFFNERTICCPACIPFEYLPEVMLDAARTSSRCSTSFKFGYGSLGVVGAIRPLQ